MQCQVLHASSMRKRRMEPRRNRLSRQSRETASNFSVAGDMWCEEVSCALNETEPPCQRANARRMAGLRTGGSEDELGGSHVP